MYPLSSIRTTMLRRAFFPLRHGPTQSSRRADDAFASVARFLQGCFETCADRTNGSNDIMKILTLTSVILLPGALIAGVMGMNFKAGLFESTWLFYVVVVVSLAIAAITISVAKLRDWI